RDPDGLGWQLDRRRFSSWLQEVAISRGAKLFAPAEVTAVTRMGDGWRVSLSASSGNVDLCCRVILDAAGRAAPLATRVGARRRRLDRLVCGWVEGNDCLPPGAGVTFVEAVEDGWWYTARGAGR